MHELFTSAVADFAEYNQARNRSDRTTTWYTYQLNLFGEFIEKRGVAPASVSGRDILAFMAQERAKGLSDMSLDSRYRALRAFFRWVVEFGYLDGLPNPVTAKYKPAVKRKIKRAAKTSEIKQLLTSIDGEAWIDFRDRALISLLFRTGLRRAEVAGLRVSNLDFPAKRLFVDGNNSKSGTDALVPFDDETKRLLVEYLYNRPPHPTCQDVLWYAGDGAGGVKRDPLSGDGVYLVMKRRCEEAGLPRLNPQSCRRGYGGALLNAGVNIGEVSALLRHSSVKITEDWYVEHELAALETAYHAAQARLR
ncbi:MAG TPA: tyrosine-type recombinase/integrase [Candidatus Competibacter phosphatis]|nr:tyrosine-type recombinase/integrase [Candidatus Competibacter phosphatis]